MSNMKINIGNSYLSNKVDNIPEQLQVSIQPQYLGITNITSTSTGRVLITKYGNNVTLTFSTLLGTTQNTWITIPQGVIPSEFLPSSQAAVCGTLRVYDNNVNKLGSFDINQGNIIINGNIGPATPFGNNPNSGFFAFSVSYNL